MQPKRIVNVTRGIHWKFNRAERAVYECACEWVEYGVSVRDLTLAESIAGRNKQAANSEPLPYVEIRGLRYDGPIPTDYTQILAADEFARQASMIPHA